MKVTRRKALKIAGSSIVLGAIPGAASAENDQRVFVHPNGDRSAAISALEDRGGRSLITYDNFDFVAGAVPAEKRRDLGDDPRVDFVETDGEVEAGHHKDGHTRGGGNGGGGDCQTAEETPWGVDYINADLVDEATGAGIDVAVLDTGIDTDHQDLVDNIGGGHDCTDGKDTYEDGHGHGTHVSGTVGAVDNDIGVIGVAPAVNLWAYKVLDDKGSGYWSWVVCGIDQAMNAGDPILSMSLGGGYNDTAAQAIKDAYSAGHLIVTSAGNKDNDEDGSCEEDNVTFPATMTETFTVGGIENPDNVGSNDTIIWAGSSVGPELDVAAPAQNVLSTWNDGCYDGTLDGTSMACPHVSGAAALCWEVYGGGPDTTTRDGIEDVLLTTAEAHTGTCEEGAGVVDAEAAVDEAVARTSA